MAPNLAARIKLIGTPLMLTGQKPSVANTLHCEKITVKGFLYLVVLEKIDPLRMAGHIMLTPAQLRAARALLGWSRDDLAERSGVFANTITNFEHGISDPKQGTILKWRRALAAAGVEFQDEDEEKGAGVRLKHPGDGQGRGKKR